MSAKNSRKPSILIVLNKLPDDLSFLTAKFVGLSRHFDVDIVSWDTRTNREKYRKILHSRGFSGKVYLQPMQFTAAETFKFIGQNFAFFTLKPARVFGFVSAVKKLHPGEAL